MSNFDFHAPAELYLGSTWQTARAQGARNFRTAAQALRFAFEEAAPVSLHGANLVIGETSFTGPELAGLYRNLGIPAQPRIN
ncbi:MAG: hypothetical protein P0Y65_16915 [Candidatus Devosia phytovorans]|uniref:Uncharacterized protein n=1 Tax=Candidatus Devosia phytovorans TaxID=3121372 RepID=A0AAJ5VS78_9HYPH|nr:hypothetical protein [Devosia sp.]WEK03853.1 MAG: hypothetical protein P0Y65_16915 [Devosia sp.]